MTVVTFNDFIEKRLQKWESRSAKTQCDTLLTMVLDNEDISLPNNNDTRKALMYLSGIFDYASLTAYNDLVTLLKASQEHKRRVYDLSQELKKHRICKESSPSNAVFKDVSSLEQMVAIADVIEQTIFYKQHSFYLAVKPVESMPNYIPVSLKNNNLMGVILGSSTGNQKMPKYENWAFNDPRQNSSQKRFIKPLECLEIVRQPNFSSATIIKGNAFKNDIIEQDWRYGSYYACVEDSGQNKNSQKKLKSSALNTIGLVENDLSNDEIQLNPDFKFEKWSSEGYDDDAQVVVSASKLLRAAEKVLGKENLIGQNASELNKLAMQLLIMKTGPFNTPTLNEFALKELLS